MQQLLMEKTKKDITDAKNGLIGCDEIPKCPRCRKEMQFQENPIFKQKVYWNCENEKCIASSFMRIKMGNSYFLIRP